MSISNRWSEKALGLIRLFYKIVCFPLPDFLLKLVVVGREFSKYPT